MVDVANKPITHRIAKTYGKISMSLTCFEMVRDGTHRKGDVISIARIAGIMATKKTSDLIPLCHPLAITKASLEFELDEVQHCVHAWCEVETDGKTGVEMEALMGVQIALLTIYDMCKAIDRGMEISEVHLVKKDGGKSGLYQRGESHA